MEPTFALSKGTHKQLISGTYMHSGNKSDGLIAAFIYSYLTHSTSPNEKHTRKLKPKRGKQEQLSNILLVECFLPGIETLYVVVKPN